MATRRKPVPPQSVVEAIGHGQRAVLDAMQRLLAEAMLVAEPAVVAQIAGRLQAVTQAIADLQEPERSSVDELAAERARRRAGADGGAPTAERPQQRRARGG